ncbi:MAG: hypothetical protein S0880_10310 [Actinomycetota bacterium]|nr:hypothetical protein [Actinomycetota bacterium]
MPDLLAGSTVQALDTPPAVADDEATTFTFNDTSYGVDADTGSPGDCGVAFVAPTTGRVIILFRCFIDNNGANFSRLAPHVRTGSTVGSGTDVYAASDVDAITNDSNGDGETACSFVVVTGLTAGNDYNVRLEHRATAGIGTITRRSVAVIPLS